MQDYGPFETLSDSLHLRVINAELDITGLRIKTQTQRQKAQIV